MKLLYNSAPAAFWLWKAAVTVLGSVAGTLKLKWWGCCLHGPVKCVGLPRIERSAAGMIEFGHGVCLRSARSSNIAGVFQPVSLGTLRGGRIVIGDGCGISGSTLVAAEQITLGKHVLLGVGCRIFDCDFHPVDASARIRGERGKSAAVVLEDDVWLAAGVTVLKGVTIGKGTVVSAASVVTRSLPAGVLAAGNPARVIRTVTTDAGRRKISY